MTIDLEQELARVARSVHDDALAERMSGQVRSMVGRIKRRRATRHAAQGMVGIGAAAAVVLGGAQLAGRPGTLAPPASTTGPSATAEPSQCGTAVTDPNPEVSMVVGLVVDAAPTIDGTLDPLEVTVSFTGAVSEIATLEGDPQLVITRDGVVVSPLATLSSTQESMPPIYHFSQPLSVCGPGGAAPAGLPDGEYELRATQWVTFPDSAGPVQLVGAAPLTIGPGGDAPDGITPTPELTPEQAQAKVRIEAWLAAPVTNPDAVFPRCGAQAVLDDGSTPLVLDPPFEGLGTEVDEDGTFQTTVTMRTRDGQYVIGNAAGSGATLVLLKDGVVVGYQWLDSEDLTLVDLQPDQTLEIPLRGSRMLCGTGEGGTGPALPLPRDTYQAVAVVDVMLKEVGTPGGSAESVTRTVPVMSSPVDVTIQ